MFTFSCSTCEAKLVVKNEKLVGKILACPNCGSMVLVQPPAAAPTPPPHPQTKPTIRKRFPDILSYGTDTGIIGPVPEENRRSSILLEAVPETDVYVTEVKSRKILVGILIGLSAFLLAALGFLMVFHKPKSVPPPVQVPPLKQEPIPQVPPEPPLLVKPPIEPGLVQAEVIDIPVENPIQEPTLTPETILGEQTQNESDTLSVFAEKMPGFVDISVPNIDIDAKLTLPILKLDFNQHPPRLIGFVRIMSGLTGIPMTLDIDEMKPRALSVKTPVDTPFREATAEKILSETLATRGLQWTATDRQILIRPQATVDAVDLTFDVSDFAENTKDLTPEVLADMILKLVVPEANVTVLPDHRLTIAADETRGKSSQRQRDEVLRFLEQLRVIRQLPQKTEWTGETLAPEAFGWDQVIEPITLNYYQAVPLSRAVTQLESLTKLTILVDHQSLHRSLCSFVSLRVTVRCDHGTVNDAMELLLASVDSVALAYRIIDHETLEITTAESARQPEKMAAEVHRYQLRGEETPEEFVRLLRSTVAPESWLTAELPETKHAGNIVIDVPSNSLLVRQSQPVQRQIRLYLSDSEWLAP
jgi:DNA-directed RNA polymerase subunit RPC12/RpoP